MKLLSELSTTEEEWTGWLKYHQTATLPGPVTVIIRTINKKKLSGWSFVCLDCFFLRKEQFLRIYLWRKILIATVWLLVGKWDPFICHIKVVQCCLAKFLGLQKKRIVWGARKISNPDTVFFRAVDGTSHFHWIIFDMASDPLLQWCFPWFYFLRF